MCATSARKIFKDFEFALNLVKRTRPNGISHPTRRAGGFEQIPERNGGPFYRKDSPPPPKAPENSRSCFLKSRRLRPQVEVAADALRQRPPHAS